MSVAFCRRAEIALPPSALREISLVISFNVPSSAAAALTLFLFGLGGAERTEREKGRTEGGVLIQIRNPCGDEEDDGVADVSLILPRVVRLVARTSSPITVA